VALAKKEPGQIQYASGGIGGSLHLGFELFKMVAGIDVLHCAVPRRRARGDRHCRRPNTKAIIATVTTVSSHVRSGKLRALGVSGTKRSATMPDVPTIEEAGAQLRGRKLDRSRRARRHARAIVAKLNKEIAAVQDLPEVQKRFAEDGADVVKMSPSAFGTYMEQEMTKWGRVIKGREYQGGVTRRLESERRIALEQDRARRAAGRRAGCRLERDSNN